MTVAAGITRVAEAPVPNPIKLRPYRTFLEVEQPASLFVFRLRENKEAGIQAALFEADGGMWENLARLKIKDFLHERLADKIILA